MAWKKKKVAKQKESDESELPELPAPPKTKDKPEVQQEEDSDERWVVQQIPIQSSPFIVDKQEDKVYTVETALVKILNNQEEILSVMDE